MDKKVTVALMCIVGLISLMDVATAQTPLDPQKAVTLADVRTLSKGSLRPAQLNPDSSNTKR